MQKLRWSNKNRLANEGYELWRKLLINQRHSRNSKPSTPNLKVTKLNLWSDHRQLHLRKRSDAISLLQIRRSRKQFKIIQFLR